MIGNMLCGCFRLPCHLLFAEFAIAIWSIAKLNGFMLELAIIRDSAKRKFLSQKKTRRVQLLIAAALPFSVLLSRPAQWEFNLTRVYARISKSDDFDELASWCGLRSTSATPAERDELSRIAFADGDAFAVGPYGDFFRHDRRLLYATGAFHWERIHHVTDPGQWIGLGVFDTYQSGTGMVRSIILRVPVGFSAAP